MSAAYTRDPRGVVHVLMPGHGWEFTMCDQPVVDAVETEDAFREGAGERHGGPATCPACKAAVDEIREALRGVRWRVPHDGE